MISDVNCIDSSSTYLGTTNLTKNGHSCVLWSEISRSLWNEIELEELYFFKQEHSAGHNYCRKVVGMGHELPWCYYLSDGQAYLQEECEIPTCGTYHFSRYIYNLAQFPDFF